ncbi:unnamed protein product [Pedinophyceae sp. YPF-701]|nr:unnamed protein product [Pedinophyceae sp. YPF-701]
MGDTCAMGPVEGAPRSPFEMIAVDKAQKIILSRTEPLPATTRPLEAVAGCVAAGDVAAREDLPQYPTSIKDGYAVVAADGPGEYPVVAEVRAGAGTGHRIAPGQVAYITTGSPLPEGADAVVMVEQSVKLDAGADGVPRVRIASAATPGLDVRQVGGDMAAGTTVLCAGEYIGAPEVGILATVGAVQVPVHSAPSVAVLSTGDEVVDPSATELKPGQVRDSNRALLVALLKQSGAHISDLGIAADTLQGLIDTLKGAIAGGAHVVVTSGGVSMGDRDYVKAALDALGGTIHFGRVLMKPGKPLVYATIPGGTHGAPVHFFGLPGNPVSSFVTFHLAVAPCLKKLAGFGRAKGDAACTLPRVRVKLGFTAKLDPERPEYHRAGLTFDAEGGCFVAHTTGGQASSRLLSVRSASALLVMPQRAGTLPEGEWVDALLLHGPTLM